MVHTKQNRPSAGNTGAVSKPKTQHDLTKIAYLQSLAKSCAGADNRSQCDRLREALSRYALTSFEAMRYLDVYHVPARILQLRDDLRNDGDQFEIKTTRATVVTEQGHTHRVGLYTLGAKGMSNV